ncbi:uncharacterized protein LOC114184981 [Vigna unguiculata]|uniref:uncharacterized protein LOC114184981 n=1 Tax=Vigna unguiculata TaxID=3917 RepID=UPI001016DA00|nr:uncharacterized protein LOC114184981 [Vigna unguiculata]XP_027928230.1 uncharacterized protein LOC114184981 [Vigna unguiculata]XP_027928232.1 uncharacterized protein LOC114184981 [Vigna unguiculata]
MAGPSSQLIGASQPPPISPSTVLADRFHQQAQNVAANLNLLGPVVQQVAANLVANLNQIATEDLNRFNPIIQDYGAEIRRLEDVEKLRNAEITRLGDLGRKQDEEIARLKYMLEDLTNRYEAGRAKVKDLEEIKIPDYESKIKDHKKSYARLKKSYGRSKAQIGELKEHKEQLTLTLDVLRKGMKEHKEQLRLTLEALRRDKKMCLDKLDRARIDQEELKKISIQLDDNMTRLHQNINRWDDNLDINTLDDNLVQ